MNEQSKLLVRIHNWNVAQEKVMWFWFWKKSESFSFSAPCKSERLLFYDLQCSDFFNIMILQLLFEMLVDHHLSFINLYSFLVWAYVIVIRLVLFYLNVWHVVLLDCEITNDKDTDKFTQWIICLGNVCFFPLSKSQSQTFDAIHKIRPTVLGAQIPVETTTKPRRLQCPYAMSNLNSPINIVR